MDPIHPEPASVLGVEIHLGADRRQSVHQAALDALYSLVAGACARARLDRSGWRRQDTVNGEVALIPGTVPRQRLVVDLVGELASALRTHNGDRAVAGRLRLRVAIHHDAAPPDAAGSSDGSADGSSAVGPSAAGSSGGPAAGGLGPPAAVVRRMLDAPQVSFSLDVRRADLAVIVSDSLYQEARALPGGSGFRPDAFRRVWVRDRGVDMVYLERSAEAPAAGLVAWIHVPDPTGFPPAGS